MYKSLSIIVIFSVLFFLGGCSISSNKGLNLTDNVLKVHVTPGWPNPHYLYKGQNRYSLYKLKLPQDGGNYLARLHRYEPNISVEKDPISSGDAVDSIVTFYLPSDKSISRSCVVVVNVGSWVTPIKGRRGLDSRHLIGLKPYEVIYDLSRLKEEMNTILEHIQSAKFNIYKTKSYINGSCHKKEIDFPRKPNNSFKPSEAEKIAEAVVLEAMAQRLGCEVLSEVLRNTRLIGAWDRFERRFTCGRNNLSSLYPMGRYTPFIDFIESTILTSCSSRNKKDRTGCILTYGGLLVGRFFVEKDLVYRNITTPYLKWKKKVESLEFSINKDFRDCSKYKSIIDNSTDVISEARLKIEKEERHLFSQGFKKNEDGDFLFEGDSLTCNASLTDYSTKKNGIFIGVR